MAKQRKWLRVALQLCGALLGIAGIVFVVLRVQENAAKIELQDRGAFFWASVGLLTLAYGAANTLLARAWWSLLKSLGLSAAWRWALWAYGVSQLAKYVPGNFFHLAGRQALGQGAGFAAKPVASSTAYELALLVAAGVLCSALALPLLVPSWPPLLSPLVFALVVGAAVAGLWCRRGALVARALAFQSLFLVVSGAVFVATLALVSPHAAPGAAGPVLCGAYVAAWLLGFLTPGAPAGLGVRELVMLFLLDDLLPTHALLSAVLLARVVSMIGDLLFFLATGGMRARNPAE